MCFSDETDELDGQNVVEGDDDREIRRKVEIEIRKHSHDFEWHADNSVSVVHRVQGRFQLPGHEALLTVSYPISSAFGSERIFRKRHFRI